MTMRRSAVLAVLLLASACGRGDQEAPASVGYRDRTVPIASKALFDPAEYAGLWHEVARYPTPFEADCANATFEFTAQMAVRHTCLNADDTVRRTLDGTMQVVGPGRLSVSFGTTPFVAADFWVLWTDETYRTAVIGTPDGRAGWILNREPAIPSDRMNAAREILDFNGYDVSRLQTAGG